MSSLFTCYVLVQPSYVHVGSGTEGRTCKLYNQSQAKPTSKTQKLHAP